MREYLFSGCVVVHDGPSSFIKVEFNSLSRGSDGSSSTSSKTITRISCAEKVAWLVRDVGPNVSLMHASIRTFVGIPPTIDWIRPIRMVVTRPGYPVLVRPAGWEAPS